VTDPRIQQRRVEVARAAGRRRLRILGTTVGLGLIASGGLVLLHSPLFSVHRVTVVGAPGVDRAAVLAAAGLGTHPPLVDVDTAAVAARVARLPEVATVAVHEQWPSGVEIVLTGRQPVAAAPAGDRWAVLDRDGHVLAWATSPPTLPLVILPAAPGPPGSVVPAAALPLLAAATAMPASIAPSVRSLTYGPAGSIVLRMHDPLVVVLGSDSDLHQKFDSLSILLADVPTRGIATMDVSVPSAPVLTPIGSRHTVHRNGGG
jgi:cell division protein FtsQ